MKHALSLRLAALLAAAALALSGCGSSGGTYYSAESSTAYGESKAESYDMASTADGGAVNLTESALDPGTAESSRKIVYTADLWMEATDFDATREALLAAVDAAGGYLESTSQSGSGTSRSASYTARIPADNYRSFLSAAEDAGNVTSMSENADDITAEYVDVEARLNALYDQRDRLNALADKAETTADLLEIESQLSDVQYQIESYTGQMRVMNDQVQYSTVYIYLDEVVVLTTTPQTFAEKLADALASGWRGFVEGAQNVILALVYLWPVLILAAAVIALVTALRRRRRARRAAKRQAEQTAKPEVPEKTQE